MKRGGGMTPSQAEFQRLKTLGLLRDNELPHRAIMARTGADRALIAQCLRELGR